MKLHLGGNLSWYDHQKRAYLEITLVEKISLNALLMQLKIPRAEVAIVSVNDEMITDDDVILCDSDAVRLFPPIGGG
jgi:sulfur carrier protein ThiS